jgi:hypothetical protein
MSASVEFTPARFVLRFVASFVGLGWGPFDIESTVDRGSFVVEQ